MIPIKNKKKTLEATVEEMRNFSLSYLEKYSPSKQQLKTYLLKKYLKTGNLKSKKQDLIDLIDVVLIDLEKSKFISDKLQKQPSREQLIEIVLDIGRRPEARFSNGTEYLCYRTVVWQDLDYILKRLGKFSGDNRAGIEKTL